MGHKSYDDIFDDEGKKMNRGKTVFFAFLNQADQCTMQQGLTFLEGGVFTDKTGLKIFVFINAMIFAFITFVTNTPLWAKKKYIFIL